MNWNNLKKYKCPKCSANLEETVKASGKFHTCTECDFIVGDIKYGELLRSKPKFRTPTEEENLSALNNYEK